jgi:hypothetical protein
MAGLAGQPHLELSAERVSMKIRNCEIKETTVVPASHLSRCNFQKVYQGTGTPQRPDGEKCLQSIVDLSIELAVPRFDACADKCAQDRRDYFVENEGKAAADTVFNLAGILGGASGVATGVSVIQTVIAGGALTWGFGLISIPALIGMSATYNYFKHTAKKAEEQKLVEKAKEAATQLAEKFCLDEPHGAFYLYSSESTVKQALAWRVDDTEVKPIHDDPMKIYKAINKVLNDDDFPRLQAIVHYLKMLNFHINETRFPGGTVYSGISVNVHKCCLEPGTKVRIPRILSTSLKKKVASDHVDDVGHLKGILLVITVPKGFWGAREMSAFSEFPAEEEVVFPPWSQFVLNKMDWKSRPPQAHLVAIDKYAK